jgi:three-Cys-motif partner protein
LPSLEETLVTDLRDLPACEDDGLPIPEVGAWALEKYRRVWYYDQIFSTGMKAKWDQRVYIDLFSGAGLARVRGSGEIVAGSPILSLRVKDPFTKYIFCEEQADLLDALRTRVEQEAPEANVDYVLGDVNQVVDKVVEKIPSFGQGNTQLSFCFVDPFSVNLSFETIQALGGPRNMDFLILLALGMDANRNLGVYLDESHGRIERFLGDPEWREKWQEAESSGFSFIYFLALRYIEAMRTLGYVETTPDQMHAVRSETKNLGLYYLAFFSKAKLGGRFWKEVLHYSDDQLGLEI